MTEKYPISKFRTLILLAILIFSAYSCEKWDFLNPNDPKSHIEPGQWAPSNLNVTPINDSQVQLTWKDNCDLESGFKIERKSENSTYKQIAEVGANIATYIDTNLSIEQKYTYRVYAFTEVNKSKYSNEKSIQTTFPSPTNLTATPISDSQVKLEWQDNCAFETGFRIERKADTGTFQQIAEIGANVTTYTDDSLNIDVNYTYRVNAITKVNKSAYSNEVSAQTTLPAPTDLTATPISDSQIKLDWKDNSSFENGFRIERKIGSGGFQQVAEVGANLTSYTDDNLTYGETYYYRVRAYTQFNNSDYSNEKSIQTTFPYPTNLIATPISDSQVKLEWQDNCTFETGFRIERKADAGTFQQIAEVNANITSFTDNNLTYGETYSYRVRACTQLNNSNYSNETNIQMVIPPPSNLNATPVTDSQIKLEWQDNSSFETGFQIERKTVGGNFQQVAKVGANVKSFTDDNLTYGETYYYRVRAYTQFNNSDYSNEKSVQTIFPAPSNLTATPVTDSQIKLEWQDNCTFETGFRIERKADAGTFQQIAEVNANITSFTDNNLTYGETYIYRVRAYTQLNNSNYSNETNIQMVIPPPSNLTATPVTDSQIKLDWQDNCLFETGFRIERNDGNGYTLIAEVGADVITYTDVGLIYGRNYTYRVKAFTINNESEYSNDLQTETVFPSPSNLLTSVINNQDIKLTWQDNCSFEMGFKIERMKEAESFSEIASTNPNNCEYIDRNIEKDITYSYRVCSFTDYNKSNYSNVSSISVSSLEGIFNGTWKVTSTTNSSSSSDLILNEILTFSNSTYNGTEVSGDVALVSTYYGSVNGTYVFNPTGQTLIITYTKSPNRKTYLGVSISGTTLSFSSAHDNFTLKKQ